MDTQPQAQPKLTGENKARVTVAFSLLFSQKLNDEFLPPDQSTAGTTRSHPPEGGRQPAQENQPCQKRLIGSPQDARRLQRFGAKIGTGS